jgi:hypothetical protein
MVHHSHARGEVGGRAKRMRACAKRRDALVPFRAWRTLWLVGKSLCVKELLW